MLILLIPVLQGLFVLLMVLLLIGLALWAIAKVLDVWSEPVKGPHQKLIGQLGRVSAPIGDEQKGKVVVWGELWDALPSQPLGAGMLLAPNTEIRVETVDRMDPRLLRVSPVSAAGREASDVEA